MEMVVHKDHPDPSLDVNVHKVSIDDVYDHGRGELILEEVLLQIVPWDIIQGREYLFLVDIQFVIGFREDEALSALYNWETNCDFDYPEETLPQCTNLGSRELGGSHVGNMVGDV